MNNPNIKRERVSTLHVVKPGESYGATLSNERAETALIGAAFHAPDLYPTLSSIVQPSDFFSLMNGLIWWACEQVYPNIDNVTVLEALKGKISSEEQTDRHINAAIAETLDTANAEHYALMVRESAVRIRIHNALEEMRAALYSDKPLDAQIDTCNTLLFKASEQAVGLSDTSVQALFSDLWDDLEAKDTQLPGTPTGFRQLDAHLKRIYNGEVALLVGHPGMGKTNLALSMVRNVLNAGGRVVMFTLDNMPGADMIRILTAMETGIHKVALLEKSMSPDQWATFVQCAPRINAWKLDIIDEFSSLTPTQLRRKLRKLVRDHGQIDLVVIDGLWLMQADEPTQKRNEDLHGVTNELMNIARKEFGLPMLVTHQYNQDAKDRNDKRPRINDLAESAAVQRNIPLILGMHRDNYYNRESTDESTQVYILKDRKRGRQGESVSFLYDKGAYVEAETVTIDFGGQS